MIRGHHRDGPVGDNPVKVMACHRMLQNFVGCPLRHQKRVLGMLFGIVCECCAKVIKAVHPTDLQLLQLHPTQHQMQMTFHESGQQTASLGIDYFGRRSRKRCDISVGANRHDFTRIDGNGRGQRGHHGLARADVALQQAVHGLRSGQVGGDLLGDAALRTGQLEGQRRQQLLVQATGCAAQRRGAKAGALTLGLQLDAPAVSATPGSQLTFNASIAQLGDGFNTTSSLGQADRAWARMLALFKNIFPEWDPVSIGRYGAFILVGDALLAGLALDRTKKALSRAR